MVCDANGIAQQQSEDQWKSKRDRKTIVFRRTDTDRDTHMYVRREIVDTVLFSAATIGTFTMLFHQTIYTSSLA